MKGYGQFCPVAMAATLLTERWTLLVVRELLMGSRHFNQLRRGLPLMSPTLLSRRLQTLQEHGVVERHEGPDGQAYVLSEAGRELLPLVEAMGSWGKRWVATGLNRRDIDVRLLMWAMHREFNLSCLPQPRLVLYIDLVDGDRSYRHFWLILDQVAGRPDLCLQDPGDEVDLVMTTDVVTLTRVYMGDEPFDTARGAGRIRVQGPPKLARTLPKWFARSLFADVPREAAVVTGPAPATSVAA